MSLIKASDLAARAGLSTRTLRRLVAAGKVPGARKGHYHNRYELTPALGAWIYRRAKAKREAPPGKTPQAQLLEGARAVSKRAELAFDFVAWMEQFTPACRWETIPPLPGPERKRLRKGAAALQALASDAAAVRDAEVF